MQPTAMEPLLAEQSRGPRWNGRPRLNSVLSRPLPLLERSSSLRVDSRRPIAAINTPDMLPVSIQCSRSTIGNSVRSIAGGSHPLKPVL